MAINIQVPTADYAIASAPDSLSTVGIGSCIVICLYAPTSKMGALLHCMLPREENDLSNSLRNVDTAVNQVVEQFLAKNIQLTDLIAKIAGGAQMFSGTEDNGTSIGKRNIEETKRLLTTLKIPIMGEEIGGTRARSLIFELETGKVTIITAQLHTDESFDTELTKIL
jgi:chemotaxis protein CheD